MERKLTATQFHLGPAGRLDYSRGQEPYVMVERGQFGCVIFGPYQVFEPGEYEVTFVFAVDDRFVPDGQNFCRVDVASDFGNHILVETTVNTNYIEGKGAAQVALRFVIDEPLSLEFRLYSLGTQVFSAKYERKVQVVRSFPILRLIQRSLKASVFGRSPVDKFYILLVGSLRNLGLIRRRLMARRSAAAPIDKFYTDNFARFQRYTYLGAKITPSPPGVVLDWMGIKLLIQHQEDLAIFYEVFRCNSYHFVSAGSACVIDIGMNVGIASLHFAKMPQVSVVHAFEPFARPFARALENFALNPELSPKIKPNRVGLAADNEVATVKCSKNTIGTSIRGNDGPDEDTITIKDASDALRPIFDEALRLRHVMVLKLDCEGSEFAILDSLRRSKLLVDVKILMVEWHKWWSPDQSNQNIVEILSQAGFVVFDLAHLDDAHASMIYAVRA